MALQPCLCIHKKVVLDARMLIPTCILNYSKLVLAHSASYSQMSMCLLCRWQCNVRRHSFSWMVMEGDVCPHSRRHHATHSNCSPKCKFAETWMGGDVNNFKEDEKLARQSPMLQRQQTISAVI